MWVLKSCRAILFLIIFPLFSTFSNSPFAISNIPLEKIEDNNNRHTPNTIEKNQCFEALQGRSFFFALYIAKEILSLISPPFPLFQYLCLDSPQPIKYNIYTIADSKSRRLICPQRKKGRRKRFEQTD